MHSKKNQRRVFKKKFLLSSKKCWLIEEKLLPVYSHLVQSYSDQLGDTWTVKVEESHSENIEDAAQIKQEPAEDYGSPLMHSMSKPADSLEGVSASHSSQYVSQDLNDFNPSVDSSSSSSNSSQQTSLTGPIVDKETPNNRTCTVCSRVFARTDHLTVHMRIHSGEKPFACTECDKRFCQKGDLNKHLLTHTGERPYSCEKCSYTCSRKYHLTQHLQTHTGVKPYTCDVCGVSFSNGSNLTQHKQTHTGEKKHKCEQCDKMFARSTNLTKHIRTHTGEKPYRCDVCGKMFSCFSSRNQHSKRCTSTSPSIKKKE